MKNKKLKLFVTLSLGVCSLLCSCTPQENVTSINQKYDIKSVKIDGVDISEFELYTPTYQKGHSANPEPTLFDLTLLQDNIADSLKKDLEIASTMENGKHYIIVDHTSRVEDEYSFSVKDGNLYIKGSYNSAINACDYFVEDYLQTFKTENVNITSNHDMSKSLGKKSIYTKEQLMSVLTDVYNDEDHMIVGQETDGRRFLSDTLEKFEDETDELPGILGMDLGVQGYGSSPLEWNDSDWSRFICEAVDYTANGGILTISVHYKNPSENYNGNEEWCKGVLGDDHSKSGYEKAFSDLITAGTDLNNYFLEELDANAKFLKALKDNGVPVLFRPLHENNGNWFWWCSNQDGITVDASCYVNLWKYLHDYYTNTWGLDNLLWVYSPNVSAGSINGNRSTTMYNYPGDEYVDIVGVDWYTEKSDLEIRGGDCYTSMVEETNKIGTLCEFGPTNNRLAGSSSAQEKLYNCMDVFDDLMTLKEEGYKFAYSLHWTHDNVMGISSMGKGFEYMQEDFTLGQADVKDLFDNL